MKKNVYQIAVSLLIIGLVTLVLYSINPTIDHSSAALVLLFSVSICAITLRILPVLIAATVSAVLLNYFFISPRFTLHIDSASDVLFFFIFFVVALVNGILSRKIRIAQTSLRDKQEKEKIIHLYNTLLNSLSHELRTPLSTIIASIDTLNFKQNNLTTAQRKTLLNEIAIASNRLNDQVENLLNMSRLESGILQLKPNWCDINELIQNVLNTIQTTNSQKILFEENANMPLINIDAGVFEIILHNLISNALIHNADAIQIFIKATLKENDILELTIADNGVGVNDEQLEKLFEKFYRVPHKSKGGTGLGLSIVKGYISFLNGTIVAKHNLPYGLLFEIEVPVEISYINKLKNE